MWCVPIFPSLSRTLCPKFCGNLNKRASTEGLLEHPGARLLEDALLCSTTVSLAATHNPENIKDNYIKNLELKFSYQSQKKILYMHKSCGDGLEHLVSTNQIKIKEDPQQRHRMRLSEAQFVAVHSCFDHCVCVLNQPQGR